jgi:hypothetical protein
LTIHNIKVGRGAPLSVADHRHRRLLRARRERPCGSRAAEQRDELASPHSITSSSRPGTRHSRNGCYEMSGQYAQITPASCLRT